MTQQAVRDEPVAWLIHWRDQTYRGAVTVSFNKCSDDDGTCEPLYTHPYPHAQHVAHDAAVVELIGAAERVRDFGGPPLIRNEDEYNRAYAALGASIEVLRAHKESPQLKPNKTTIDALRSAERLEGDRFGSAEDFFAALDEDAEQAAMRKILDEQRKRKREESP